jgi:hypothetical protein
MSSTVKRTGKEPFHSNGIHIRSMLFDFWRWADSDLRSNATRGRIAEYIVAMDLKVAEGIRREWLSFDLTHLSGVSVEVKSAAYVQGWKQRRPSLISFGIRPTTAWNPDTAEFAPPPRRRQAAVYVFALQAEKDVAKMDPLNLAQWQFFVLSTSVLNVRAPNQKQITLGALRKLKPTEVSYGGIATAVVSEANRVA